MYNSVTSIQQTRRQRFTKDLHLLCHWRTARHVTRRLSHDCRKGYSGKIPKQLCSKTFTFETLPGMTSLVHLVHSSTALLLKIFFQSCFFCYCNFLWCILFLFTVLANALPFWIPFILLIPHFHEGLCLFH